MEQEEGLLTLTDIASSSKYKLESETSMISSPLPLYTSSPPILPPLPSSPLPITPPFLHNMSQYSSIDYKQIIQQQQEQLVALQAQLQAL